MSGPLKLFCAEDLDKQIHKMRFFAAYCTHPSQFTLLHSRPLHKNCIISLINSMTKKNCFRVRRKGNSWGKGFRGTSYYFYHNVPKFSDRQIWANSADPEEQSDQGLHCLQFPLHRMHYSKEMPSYSTFRVITANFRLSKILGFLQ